MKLLPIFVENIKSTNYANCIYYHEFKPSEIKMMESIIEDNQEVIAQHWNRYFNKSK